VCCYTTFFIPSVVKPIVVILGFVKLSVVTVTVVIPSVSKLSVVKLIVMTPFVCCNCVFARFAV
jgi:hypothetical protein